MIDLMVLGGYFLVMLFAGWRGRRQTAEAFWIAERRYLTGPVTLSLVATIFGASSTMGIIGLGYRRGLTGAWWSLIGGIALIPFALLLAGRVRALNVYTLPDILKKAYGERVAVPAGVMIAVAWCGVIAAQLIAGGAIAEQRVLSWFPVGHGSGGCCLYPVHLLGGPTNGHQDRLLAVLSFLGRPRALPGLPLVVPRHGKAWLAERAGGTLALSGLKRLWMV
jgi:uncharacterized sodium:solute symporter family permease YidK